MSHSSNEPSPQSTHDSADVELPDFAPAGRPIDEFDAGDIRFGEAPPSVEVSVQELPIDGSDGNESFARVRPKNTRRSSRLLLLTLLIGLTLGAIAGLWFFSSFWQWQLRSREQVAERYQEHPIVIEHLGGIESCSFSVFETAGPDVEEDNVVAFKVQGPERFGFIYIRSSTGEPKDAEWAALKVGDQVWRLEND